MTTRPRTVQTVTDPETGRIYPIPAGGADDAPPVDGDSSDDSDSGDGTDDSSDDDGSTGDDDAGRAGGPDALRADLVKERERRRQERQRRRDLEAEVARLRGETESEVERAAREARTAALAPAIAAVRRTAVETAARDAGFANPALAYRLIDPDTIEVDDEDLEVDREQVRTAVEELAGQEPYLLTDDARRRADGRGSGTPRGGVDTQSGTGSNGTGTDPSGSFLTALRSKAGTR